MELIKFHRFIHYQLLKKFWDKLKANYAKSNKASQIAIHKRLMHLTMTDAEFATEFVEEWQNTLNETTSVRLTPKGF